MPYLFGTSGGLQSNYNVNNVYSGRSPWYGGAGASATDPSSIPGYGGTGTQPSSSSWPGQAQQQNPYNNLYPQQQPAQAVGYIAPLMGPVTQSAVTTPYQQQQPVYQQPAYQQPVYQQPVYPQQQPAFQQPQPVIPPPPIIQRNAWGRTPEEETAYQAQLQAQQQAAQQAWMQQQAEQQRQWQEQIQQEQARQEQARLQQEQARLAWEQQQAAAAAAQQAERERIAREDAARAAAARQAFMEQAQRGEDEWYTRSVGRFDDFDRQWAAYEQAVNAMPEPNWNDIPVFRMLRGEQPAAGFQARGQAAEQALQPQAMPTMPNVNFAPEPYPVFVGRDVSADLLAKNAAVTQGWADRNRRVQQGGPKAKPIRVDIPQGHKANYQTYANLLPSERALLESGLKSQGQYADDWLEALMRSAPRGRGVGSTGWG